MHNSLVQYLNLEQTNNVVGTQQLICCSHNEGSKVFGAIIGPVLLTLDLIALFKVSYHGNSVYIFLPDHSPKVCKGFFQWTCMRYD